MDYNLVGLLKGSLLTLWGGVVEFIPLLVLAILVLVVGWMIGGLLGRTVVKLFQTIHIDEALGKAGIDDLSKRAGHEFKPGKFVGALVKWFVILAFVVVALDVLKLQEVTIFMREVVLGYLPQVFVAVLILFAAMIIGRVASKALVATLRAGGTDKADLFGEISYYLIIAFGVMAALSQLKIAADLINTLFTGIVFAVALAFGLAFGLGGKEAAARYIDRVIRK